MSQMSKEQIDAEIKRLNTVDWNYVDFKEMFSSMSVPIISEYIEEQANFMIDLAFFEKLIVAFNNGGYPKEPLLNIINKVYNKEHKDE